MKILITSTSFQDTPGEHHQLLNSQGFEIDTLRGPLKEEILLPIIGNYDGIICGDDEITEEVIKNAAKGKLKIISKYGIGLDKINLTAARKNNIPVTNCIGENHVTVAEHFFSLLLTFLKNIHLEYNIVKRGGWKRLTGNEIHGKKIGIIGLGRIGKEIALRAKAFGLELYGYDKLIDNKFIKEHKIIIEKELKSLVNKVDIISLNLTLSKSTKGIISLDLIKNHFKRGVILVNTARGGLVDEDALIYGLKNGILRGYLTDVLDEEPMPRNYPLLKYKNVLITPHIGSRTFESVERQGKKAVENLISFLKDKKPC